MPTVRETGQHVIVTGGSSGIGAAVGELLVARGHSVTVLDLQPPAAGAGVDYEPTDVSNESAVVRAIESAEARSGTITAVVTCHGIRGQYVPALDLDLERTRRVIDIHLMGTLSVCREVVRRLNGRPASIVTISSTTAYNGWVNQSDYGVAKAAVRQLTLNLAVEWAPLAVRVNSIAPGHTMTPMVRDLIAAGYDVAATEARVPLGRLATPEEMAGSIAMLLLDSPFVTGQCLAVDGGWTAVGK